MISIIVIVIVIVIIAIFILAALMLLQVHGLLCGLGLRREAGGSRVGGAAGLRAVCLPDEGRI